MAAKITGVRQASEAMNRLIGDIQGKKAVRAIYKALFIGGAQAALYTPIDTSTLINSQYRDVTVKGSSLFGKVGYTAEYAMAVHDPNHRQKFRRATAKKEFLKLGFDEMREQIDKAVADEMKL